MTFDAGVTHVVVTVAGVPPSGRYTIRMKSVPLELMLENQTPPRIPEMKHARLVAVPRLNSQGGLDVVQGERLAGRRRQVDRAAQAEHEAGPAARAAQGWPYAGYRMTVTSTVEEKQAEEKSLGGQVRFYADEALRTAGGVVEVAGPNESQVVHDRELITGQNPASDEALAKVLLEALSRRRAGTK